MTRGGKERTDTARRLDVGECDNGLQVGVVSRAVEGRRRGTGRKGGVGDRQRACPRTGLPTLLSLEDGPELRARVLNVNPQQGPTRTPSRGTVAFTPCTLLARLLCLHAASLFFGTSLQS